MLPMPGQAGQLFVEGLLQSVTGVARKPLLAYPNLGGTWSGTRTQLSCQPLRFTPPTASGSHERRSFRIKKTYFQRAEDGSEAFTGVMVDNKARAGRSG
jgi:hypothetical protein